MAYRKYRRSHRSRKQRSVYKKQKPQVSVSALAKKVNWIAKRQKGTIEKVQFNHTAALNISSNYHAEPLFTPNNWQSVFGESLNVQESKKLNITKLNLDWTLEPGKEASQIDYTVFLISAKNQKVFEETAGLTAFQNNPNGQQDYCYNGALTYMSPKRFKIWKVWRCNTAGITTRVSGQIAPDVNIVAPMRSVRRYHKMPFKRYLINTTGQQNWKQIPDDQIPISCSLACVFFNNNSQADIENPGLKLSALFSCFV